MSYPTINSGAIFWPSRLPEGAHRVRRIPLSDDWLRCDPEGIEDFFGVAKDDSRPDWPSAVPKVTETTPGMSAARSPDRLGDRSGDVVDPSKGWPQQTSVPPRIRARPALTAKPACGEADDEARIPTTSNRDEQASPGVGTTPPGAGFPNGWWQAPYLITMGFAVGLSAGLSLLSVVYLLSMSV